MTTSSNQKQPHDNTSDTQLNVAVHAIIGAAARARAELFPERALQTKARERTPNPKQEWSSKRLRARVSPPPSPMVSIAYASTGQRYRQSSSTTRLSRDSCSIRTPRAALTRNSHVQSPPGQHDMQRAEATPGAKLPLGVHCFPMLSQDRWGTTPQ